MLRHSAIVAAAGMLLTATASANPIAFDVADQGLPYGEAGFDFVEFGGGGSLFTQRSIESGELVVSVGDGFTAVRMSPTGGGTFDVIQFDYTLEGPDGAGTQWRLTDSFGGVTPLDGLPVTGTLSLNLYGTEFLEFLVFDPNADGVTMRIDNIAIPEATSLALLGLGLGGLMLVRRRIV